MKSCFLVIAAFLFFNQAFAQYRIIETSEDGLTPSVPGTPEVNISFTKYKLDNGITVIINEDHSDKVISVDYMFKFGSAASPTDRTGIVYFIYQLLYGNFKNDKVSLIQNSSKIDKDFITHSQTFPSNMLNESLWQEAQKLLTFSKTVTQEQFDNNKEKILQKVQNIKFNDHMESGQNMALKTLFQFGNPYSWPVYGELNHYESFQYFDVLKFYNEWFGANNLVIVISGDVQQKSVINDVATYFGKMNSAKNTTEQIENQYVALSLGQFETQGNSRNVTYTYDYNGTVEPMLYMAYLVPGKFKAEYQVFAMIAEFLGDPEKGLITRVLQKANLADDVNVSYTGYKYTGILGISVKAKTGVELSVIKDTIEYLLNQSFAQVSPEERKENRIKIKEAKEKYKEDGSIDIEVEPENAKILIFQAGMNYVIKSGFKLTKGIESTEKKASKLAEYELYLNKANYFSTEVNTSRLMQPEMVKATGNQYLISNNPSVVSILPEGYSTLKAAKDNFKINNIQTIITNATEADLKAFTPVNFDLKYPKPIKSAVFPYPQYNTRVFENGIKFTLNTNKESSYLDLLLCFDIEKYGDIVGLPFSEEIILSVLDSRMKSFQSGDFMKQLTALGVEYSASVTDHKLILHYKFGREHLSMIKMLLKEFFNSPVPVAFDIESFVEKKTQDKSEVVSGLDKIFSSVIYYKLFQTQNGSPADGVSSERERFTIYVFNIIQGISGILSPESLSIILTGDPVEGEMVDFREFLRQWNSMPGGNIFPASPQFIDSILNVKSTLFLSEKNQKEPEVILNYLNIKTDQHSDWNNAELVKFLLVGNSNGLLSKKLERNQYVISYGISQVNTGPYISYYIHLQVKEEGLIAVLTSVNEVLKEISSFKLNRKDLKSVKNLYASSKLLGYEYYNEKSELVNNLLQYNIQNDFYQKQAKQLKKTKKSTIIAFAKDKISEDGFLTIISGNYESLSGPLKLYGFDNLVLINKKGKVIKQ